MNSFIQENTHKDIGLLEMINKLNLMFVEGYEGKDDAFLPGREKSSIKS